MTEQVCFHHWFLEQPLDCGITRATCKKCGEQRDFIDGRERLPKRRTPDFMSHQDKQSMAKSPECDEELACAPCDHLGLKG
jgi:hypothetical protein